MARCANWGGYTELENGLHYWANSSQQWLESQDFIELTAYGAAALRGPTKVLFAANANTAGAIDMVTHVGKRFRSHALGLYYFNRVTGKSVQIASVKYSLGVLYPPNQIVYPDAFQGPGIQPGLADLHYVYTKGAFAQNVVLLKAPPPPEVYGLPSDFTRLEVWTEFLVFPAVATKVITLKRELDPVRRQSMVEPDLIDEILDFGEGFFPVGRAFEIQGALSANPAEPVRIRPTDPSDPNTIVCGKRLLTIRGRTVLVESVDYSDLAAKLAILPQAANAAGAGDLKQRVVQGRTVPRTAFAVTNQREVRMAKAPYAPRGIALDYDTLSGSACGYTFLSGRTYYIPTSFYVGNCDIQYQADVVIKYGPDAWLINYGPVAFPATGVNVVMTSKDDNLIGELIIGSTGSPTYSAAQALWVYYVGFNTTVQNLVVRWAKKGIQYDSNPGTAAEHTVNNVIFRDSQTGIYNNASTVNLTSVKKCNVTTPTQSVNQGGFSGSVADDCPDMVFDTAWMDQASQQPEVVNYPATSCDVQEGAVGGSGTRRTLQFGIKLMNQGTGHFYGERDRYRRFTVGWKNSNNCHQHCHLTEWLKFELLNLDGTPAQGVTGVGKLGWLLYDWSPCGGSVSIFPPVGNPGCETAEMGMSVGYCDAYGKGTQGQWLDVTGVATGQYKLRITLNKDNRRYEGNFSNNVLEVNVTIP